MSVSAAHQAPAGAAFSPRYWYDGSRVRAGVYTDPALYDLEMTRIFHGTWVYVGHESEVAEAGDYKLTRVGGESMILARGHDERLRLLRNRCPHRGATVCQSPKGNANAFRCHYHGWTFHNTGRLVGVSFPDAYPGDTAKKGRDLEAAPRVSSYRGFVFASLNPDVAGLDKHLGLATEYLDRYVDHAGGRPLAVARQAHIGRYRGNWKMQLENGVDGYHANFTHASFFSLMQRRTQSHSRYIESKGGGVTRDLGNGHVVLDQSSVAGPALRRRLATLPGIDGLSAESVDMSEDAFQQLVNATPGPGFNVLIFPNLQLIGIHIREITPLSVGETQVTLRPLLLAGGPAAVNGLRLRYHELFYGPAGFGQPDDTEMFDRLRDGNAARDDAWISFERGLNRVVTEAGEERGTLTDEVPQRGLYNRWAALLDTPGPAPTPPAEGAAS